MHDGDLSPPARVIDFDRHRFATACAELLHRAIADRRPDALIAIPTGGMFVAEGMRDTAAADIPILPLTCRRPTSSSPARAMLVRGLSATVPRSLLDRLRVAEHAFLTRRPAHATRQEVRSLDEAEIDALRDWLRTAGAQPSLLVVDDAVDSGVTLGRVLEVVRALAPAADIRSAVISVTTEHPRAEPTYALYRQLCRFPWSLDALASHRF